MSISTLSNDNVISLIGAGLAPDTVVSIVYSTPAQTFDLSVNGLVALGQAKVPDLVVRAMQTVAAQRP